MSDEKPPKTIMSLAGGWVLAVLIGFFVFTVLASRTVQSLLGK